MNKRLKRLIIIIGLVTVVGVFSGTTVDYSADCIRCLRYERGLEHFVFGIKVYHKHGLARDDYRIIGDFRLPTIPMGSPSFYDALLESPCQHVFKRSGFGRSPLLGGSIGCGSYGEGRIFRPRRYALSALQLTHGRVPNLSLARATYDLIEQVFPSDESYDDLSDRGVSQIEEMSFILNLVESEEEWRVALIYFKSGLVGDAPFLHDVRLLRSKLESEHSSIRQTSAAVLATSKWHDDLDSLSLLLESSDPVVINRATMSIIANRNYDLYGKMLRVRKKPFDKYSYQNHTDADVLELLAVNDPVVDNFCFLAISSGQRFQMMSFVLNRLNERETSQAIATINSILQGPSPFDGKGDAWDRIEILDLSREELKEYVDVGTAPKQKDPRKWKFLNAIKSLAMKGEVTDWDFVQEAYLREVTRGVNQTYGAVMAKALMHLDLARTRNFLLNELNSDDHKRQSAALAGMGLIADRFFEPSIAKFKSSPPPSKPGNPYPAEYIFNNPYYARFLDYALHRCRGIHRWELVKDENGIYRIVNDLGEIFEGF